MGFFLRKSIKLGPFRINLSKSGIGLSGGIRGARISAGPKGTQLNSGRKGLYYRKQLTNRTAAGGGWLARLIAYCFSPKQSVTISLPQTSFGEQFPENMSPHSSDQHVTPLVNSSLRPNKILPPKPHVSYENYFFPPIELLNAGPTETHLTDEELLDTATGLAERLKEFDVTGQIKHICPGPIFTTYEYQPDPGVKYSRVTNLEDDLCLTLKAESIDIERIPGTAKVAIRVPNRQRETIYLRDAIASRPFRESASKLTFVLGETVDGLSYVVDLAKMPHLLIAGAPGMGKSVLLHSLIISLLYRARPDEVKLILMDSAGLEMNLYSDIPHLAAPVIKETSLASAVLDWTVNEMERRYRELSGWGVREIEGYNTELMGRNLVKEFDEQGEPWRPLPYIVLCIDDLSDLLTDRHVESSISRLAQKGHSVGIHLVLATQRPSVDVISGLIKASIPSRISFRVSSKIDSLTVINESGAEKLLGRGDMLFSAPGLSHPVRVHGACVEGPEIGRVSSHIRTQGRPVYQSIDELKGLDDPDAIDELFEEAVRICVAMGRASTSGLQRQLQIGYGRAAAILDTMESEGLIGQADDARPRPVLSKAYEMAAEWDARNG
ncbi:MAG: segregation ATPase FtsK/SpoIIIE, family [Blastocatellia bacterium]|jgi:S-DNA-T family DNA segregation ATPase FtsK/SpoIIIE|nr:segregation ATPase FtsK/SpoIIIE, family [Blastocatellia bacterium]